MVRSLDPTSGQRTKVRTLPLLLRLLRYAPGLLLLNVFVWTIFYTVPLVPGLVVRQYFDVLTSTNPGSGAVPSSVWVVLGLLLAAGAGRMIAFSGALLLYATFEYTIHTVLRKNLLGWLMNGPGSLTLPGSPGEAVSRF